MVCKRDKDHRLPNGQSYVHRGGGCKHKTAEAMSRADFGRLPIVRCTICQAALGRVCPDCQAVY